MSRLMHSLNEGEQQTLLPLTVTPASRCIPIERVVYHSLDAVRLFSVYSTLSLRWSYQISLELESRYQIDAFATTEAPDFKCALLSVAFMLMLSTKFANEYYSSSVENENRYWAFEQRFVEPILSSAIFFSFLDYVFGMDTVLPIRWFVVVNVACVSGVIGAFLCNQALPTSNNKLMWLPRHFRELHSQCFDPTRFERCENALLSIFTMITTFTTVCTAVNRKTLDETYPMGAKQWMMLPVISIPAAIGGLLLTEAPVYYHLYLATLRAFREGAFAYFMCACFLELLAREDSQHITFGGGNETVKMIAGLSFVLGVIIGLFAAATTLFRAKEKHANNQKAERFIKSIPEKITHLPGIFCDGFRRVKAVLCCHASEEAVNVETPTVTVGENSIRSLLASPEPSVNRLEI